ncbi:MAG: ornithine carbamoyltransferase [Candidatus Njordarchaeia archaeon]
MKLKGRDFLCLKDFDRDEIRFLLDLAHDFKRKKKIGESHELFRGKAAALIFEKHSTRTRVSLEVACNDLGILPMYMSRDQLQLARGEPIKDTARVLERYTDIIIARVYKHSTLEELAKWADIPVVNALSDLSHPLQILGDLMTIEEKIGLEDILIAYVGDGDNNVAHSLIYGSAVMGININIGSPKNFAPNKSVIEEARKIAEHSGAKINIFEDPKEAVKDANVVYTDVWVSMGQEKEEAERIKIFEPYRVTWDLVKFAAPDFLFMHCLPRHDEVADDVFESKHSIVWDQAENRLHSAKAVIAAVL